MSNDLLDNPTSTPPPILSAPTSWTEDIRIVRQNGYVTDSIAARGTRRRRGLWQHSAVRYLVTGGFCFLIDVGLLWLAHEVLGIPLPIATAGAFLLSFVVTYTLQRVVAFGGDSRVAPSALRYVLLVLVNTAATTAIVWVFSELGAEWIVGKVTAVVCTTVWNYFAYRYWVFAPGKEHPRDV